MTHVVRTLRTWVEAVVRWVVERMRDGWNYITRKVQETIRQWVEETRWVKELVSRKITVKEVVWDTQYIPFSSLITTAGIKRVIQAGITAGLIGVAVSQCSPALPVPTPTPDYQSTQVVCIVKTKSSEMTSIADIVNKTMTAAYKATLTARPTNTTTSIPTRTTTSTGTATSKVNIQLTGRPNNIYEWSKNAGWTPVQVLAFLLEGESGRLYNTDKRWFSGSETNDPAKILEEAATRWFYANARANYPEELLVNQEDRNRMMFNWIVCGMQSEDKWVQTTFSEKNKNEIHPQFVEMAERLLSKSNNPTWSEKGAEMWSWGNASLYDRQAWPIMDANNMYSWGGDSPSNKWYIFDAAQLNLICQYNTNEKARCSK